MFLTYVSRSECIAGVDAIESPWDVAKVFSNTTTVRMNKCGISSKEIAYSYRRSVRRGREEANDDFTAVVLLTAYN